jgi:hypothetical protein
MRTPVTSSNGNDGELGVDDGTSDGTGDFLGTLHSESDVSRISAVSISPIGRARSRTTGNMSHSIPMTYHLLVLRFLARPRNDSPIRVTDGDESLEPSPLTGGGLLLDRLDRHDLILQSGEEDVDDLELSNR